MKSDWRIVIDSNVLVSGLLFPRSAPGQVTEHALETGALLTSQFTFAELVSVLARPKFDRYVTVTEREKFLQALESKTKRILITCAINICRDPKDNMILELAVAGKADLIITGDEDLLSLGTFQIHPGNHSSTIP